jgi:hypothetical protein
MAHKLRALKSSFVHKIIFGAPGHRLRGIGNNHVGQKMCAVHVTRLGFILWQYLEESSSIHV